MGSLDTKSDPKILEPKHETVSNKSEPQLDSPTILELVSASDSEDEEKKIFPSVSPSSSILEDSGSKNGGKVNEGTTGYTSETPPIQVMERQTTPKYRIPSSVFGRKQSGNQDWGMASNESLFSIQMSFNYQDSFNWKSGDLERYIQEVGPIPEADETGKTHGSETGETHGSEMGENHELGEQGNSLGDTNKIQELSVPDETVNPNLHENQGRKSVVDARVSVESESAKSFAFPVLTGDTDKGGSGRKTGTLEAISERELPKQEKQPKPKAAPTWTNCFGCCTFCS